AVAVGRKGDRDPSILAARRVDGVGRTELAVIADPARDLAVRREARDDLREAVHRSLDLRDIDRLALAGAAAAPQRAEDRGREIARRERVGDRTGRAVAHPVGPAGQMIEARDRRALSAESGVVAL